MILIDFSQIIHNNIYPIKEDIIKNGLDENFDFLKHRILNSILYITNRYRGEKEIILCADSKNIWRKDIHPNYKGRRKLRRKDDGFPWNELWEKMAKFETELQSIFPFNFLKIDRAEGDDVIGTMVFYINKVKPTEKIIIVSTDKDFKQLHIAKNIVQYSPKDKKEVKALHPKNELMWLILKGDDADDVLNVKTTDLDTFVNPDKKQITMWRTTKIWEHINNNTVMDELLTDIIDPKTKKIRVSKEQLLKNFERNRNLVDLKRIPREIQMDVVQTYEENKTIVLSSGPAKLLEYFVEHKMKVMAGRLSDFSKFYKFDEVDESDISSLLGK